MILGRTSSGAIKIKADGGLRAVGCACCGGCGCNTFDVPSSLLSLLEKATSGTADGIPLTFSPYEAGWIASAKEIISPGGQPWGDYKEWFLIYTPGCFFFNALRQDGQGGGADSANIIPWKLIPECPIPFDSEYEPTSETQFTINGSTFPALLVTRTDPVVGPSMPPPNFVFA